MSAARAPAPPRPPATGIRGLFSRLEAAVSQGGFAPPPPPAQPLCAAPDRPATLGDLADPGEHTMPLTIDGWPAEQLHAFLETMMLIRATEERLGQMVDEGEVACPVHLAIGQEAVPVGVSAHLTRHDRVFGAHRSHGHYLALGGDLDGLFGEVLGRAQGCARGMGGSMHLYAPEVGFMGSVPIVAATVPLAVGAALAAAKDGDGRVAVAYFGDGAVEEGAVHESLNLARRFDLPVLFVCENNFYASHMDIAQRQPNDRTARFAEAHHVPALVVDGNDVLAVAEAAGALIADARLGRGPGYLEAVTYRWRGHVGADENVDVGVRRSADELAAWRRRDAIARLALAMYVRGDVDEEQLVVMQHSAAAAARETAARAHLAAWPAPEALRAGVYAPRRGAP